MNEDDYLMRLIAQFGVVLRKATMRILHKEYEQAERDICGAYTEFTGLSPVVADSMSAQGLIAFCRLSGSFNTDKCLMLAELLACEAELHERRGMAGASRHAKALTLLLEALAENRALITGLATKVNTLIEKLGNHSLAEGVQWRIFRYFEMCGNYGKAEDMLFVLLKADFASAEDEGIRFYRRLMCLDDGGLRAGNLPRDEVLEGLAELERRRVSQSRVFRN